MPKFRVSLFSLALMLAVPFAPQAVAKTAAATTASQPEIASGSAMIVDLNTNKVIYSNHPDLVRPIASISKLMTAMVVLDARLPLDEKLKVDIAKAESNLSIASYNKAVVEAVNDVARAASQVQTLAEKNQHQAQIERDALRVVGLAQARFNAGIIAGSRVSEARIPALRERANGLLLQGQWLDASIQLTGALGGGYKR